MTDNHAAKSYIETVMARAEAAWNKREMGTQKVLVELFKERVQQIALEHFTPSHDLHHSPGCLDRTGAAYALLVNLVRAAALIIAEIERTDRAAELKAAALGDVDA